MNNNRVVVGRALSVLEVVNQWEKYLMTLQAEAEAIRAKRPHARVVFVESDPRLDPNPGPNHPSIIHSLASELVGQLQGCVKNAGDDRDKVASAIQAWRLVMRTRDRGELLRRVDIALRRTAAAFPRLQKELCRAGFFRA